MLWPNVKIDVLIDFTGLHWIPEIGCELRDIWLLNQEELVGVDTSSLVLWGFTIIGFSHLALAYQASMPSSTSDICNIKLAYCVMVSFLEKLRETRTTLCNLNGKRIDIACAGTKRKEAPARWPAPPLIETPFKLSKMHAKSKSGNGSYLC
ncbi:7451_t:CDS:2 [Paraglomus brasilianum]|uniref:7451_t:CDS:1 n=1 Tax=Paraglomus brasilianum TaxID=144538 RepID=A0A9N9G8V8_9GLOM|nr:7451_t:CDS:2 [Paraglomus brasilianum]